ncbi:hypothetical protein SAMN03159341_10351 [Paenibacillus sp. 1_12]|uniref:hypothetical protein n=1 Tax=Paenibacillus sp. 1_12 TaxID=1566278 RepID=UPI0008E4875B|nr:hypothetical protein [Paenibacillus sp. 1_12]SFL06883.1 hypothetical protein SAMN03159341_10351 [Paenibacillus sp. 1_12]
MTLKDLWMLYEADKRILGFSTHTMKAYFLQLKMLVEEDAIHLKITCRSHREHALLVFLYCTGRRVGEVQKINIEDELGILGHEKAALHRFMCSCAKSVGENYIAVIFREIHLLLLK